MLRGDRAFAALAFAVALFLSGCNCSNNKCGPGNCPGCCDSAGTCQGGFLPAHCGADGAACAACAVGQSCAAGHCGVVSAGGGSGTGGGFGVGGGSGTGGGGFGVGGGGGGSGSQFCQNYATAYCDYVIRCGLGDSAARADCVSFLSGFYCAELQSLNKGYETLNSANATACINFIQTTACDTNPSSGGSGVCDNLFSPNSSTGQGCFSSADCKTSTDGCGGSANVCTMVCEAPGPLGAPCPCNDGLRCDQTTRTCANPHNVGEMCQPYTQFECVATAMCDTTSNTCVSLPGSGPCYQGSYCAPNAYCDFNTTTCQPRIGQDQTCSYGQCAQNLWCNYAAAGGAKCQPLLTQGSTCSAGDYSCATGLTCINNQCQPLGGIGAPCQYYSDCQSSLECDYVVHTCQKYSYSVPAGGTCTGSSLYCAYPNICHGVASNPDGGVGTAGTCGPSALGDSCTSLYDACPAQSFCSLPTDGGTGLCTASSHGSPCGQKANCLAGDYCAPSGMSGETCQPEGNTGAPCYGSGSCVSPLQCVTQSSDGGQAGLCGTLGGVNDTCAGNNSCLFPYSCVNGHCASSGHANEPCLNCFLCFNGACQQDAGTTGLGLCTGTKRADGQSCFYPTDCQSGNCQGFSVCAPACP